MTTFTLNGKTYQTDEETVAVLHSITPSAKATGDSSAVIAVVELGLATGRIVEAAPVLPAVTNHTPLKEIEYERESRDYRMLLDGQCVGYARTYTEAETTLNQLALELIASGLPRTIAELDGGNPEHVIPVCPTCGGEGDCPDCDPIPFCQKCGILGSCSDCLPTPIMTDPPAPTEDDILDKIFLPSELDEPEAGPGDVPNPDEPIPPDEGDTPPTGWGKCSRCGATATNSGLIPGLPMCATCDTAARRRLLDEILYTGPRCAECAARLAYNNAPCPECEPDICTNCGGTHHTWQCPEIGALLLRDRSIFEELPMLRSAHRTAVVDGHYVVANGLVDRGACLAECYVSCMDAPVVVEA